MFDNLKFSASIQNPFVAILYFEFLWICIFVFLECNGELGRPLAWNWTHLCHKQEAPTALLHSWSCILVLALLFLHWALLQWALSTLALLHSCTVAFLRLYCCTLDLTAMLRWAIMSSVTLKCYSKVPSMSHWAVLQCYSTAPAVSNNVFNNVTLSSVTVLRQCSSEQCDPLIGGFHSNKIVGQALSSQPTSKLKSTKLQVYINQPPSWNWNWPGLLSSANNKLSQVNQAPS